MFRDSDKDESDLSEDYWNLKIILKYIIIYIICIVIDKDANIFKILFIYSIYIKRKI
jgi:hypothetical protein